MNLRSLGHAGDQETILYSISYPGQACNCSLIVISTAMVQFMVCIIMKEKDLHGGAFHLSSFFKDQKQGSICHCHNYT